MLSNNSIAAATAIAATTVAAITGAGVGIRTGIGIVAWVGIGRIRGRGVQRFAITFGSGAGIEIRVIGKIAGVGTASCLPRVLDRILNQRNSDQ